MMVTHTSTTSPFPHCHSLLHDSHPLHLALTFLSGRFLCPLMDPLEPLPPGSPARVAVVKEQLQDCFFTRLRRPLKLVGSLPITVHYPLFTTMGPPARTRGRDYKLPNQVFARATRVEGDLLSNHTSQAEAEDVGLFETLRLDERGDMTCHLGDRVRDLASAVAYASIIKEYNATGLGEGRHEERVPEIDASAEELEEEQWWWRCFRWAENAIGI